MQPTQQNGNARVREVGPGGSATWPRVDSLTPSLQHPSPVGKSELKDIADRLRVFARERDWEQFHTPKNLAASVAIEAAELQEVFQWLDDEQSLSLNQEQVASVREELADVAIYLIRLADRLSIDLGDAILEKIVANSVRYPADVVRGISDKRR